MKKELETEKLVTKTPKGLYRKYHIQKVIRVPNPEYIPNRKIVHNREQLNPTIEKLLPVDDDAEYFVLRLDTEPGNDIEHIKACRSGIHAYAEAIKHHLPKLATDLIERYPLL